MFLFAASDAAVLDTVYRTIIELFVRVLDLRVLRFRVKTHDCILIRFRYKWIYLRISLPHRLLYLHKNAFYLFGLALPLTLLTYASFSLSILSSLLFPLVCAFFALFTTTQTIMESTLLELHPPSSPTFNFEIFSLAKVATDYLVSCIA